MKITIIVLIILEILSLGCKNLNIQEGGGSRLFEDLDIYNLKGTKEIKDTSLKNFIEIENVSDSERIIIYHYSLNELIKCNYKRKNNYWLCIYQQHLDTCGPLVYQYVLPDKVVELSYCNSENIRKDALTSVTIYNNYSDTSYYLPSGFYFNPSPDAAEVARHNYERMYATTASTQNDTFSIQTKEINKAKKLLSESKDCFKKNNKSFWWWTYFRWRQDTLSGKGLK